MVEEFEEIAHAGGKITFRVRSDDKGRMSYQTTLTSDRPVPVVIIGVHALPQGIAVAAVDFGTPSNPVPPGCFEVYIASDSQGKFGHNCPRCGGYWRSGPWPNVCPYCANAVPSWLFFSEAQRRYVRQYCVVLANALASEGDTEVTIDMDAVADAVGKEGPRPSFYVSEQSQQRKFNCEACGEFNDILGRFGYCSLCGTRNDRADFEEHTLPTLRERLNAGDAPEDILRDAVAAFDSFVSQLAKQLASLVPMTERRRARLLKHRFHNFRDMHATLCDFFDIDACVGVDQDEQRFVELKFHRRHVYEHGGGEVDQKYIDDSGDTTVQVKQRIHETKEDVHRLLGSLMKIVRNVHRGYQQLFPPIPGPIRAFEEANARLTRSGHGH